MAKLYFYYSAMNAGKTTTLLQSAYNYTERGMGVLLYTPVIDDRYEKNTIASRIGLTQPAISFDKDFNFFEDVAQKITNALPPIKCVFIDEAQFMTKKQVLELTNIADQLGIPVLTYGLRTDFLGEPFESSQYLLAWAEEIIEIKTICHCGRKATMNARINEKGEMVSEGAQVEIGGNDRYISLCHKHYKRRDVGPGFK